MTVGCCFPAAMDSPVQVVGDVDVALGSGQKENDERVL